MSSCATNLALCQSGVYYMSVKIFNKVTKYTVNSVENK